jgi:hypothetical protein
MEETINAMMEHFTPADEEDMDDYHNLIRAQSISKVTTEEDKPFNTT